MNNDMSHMGHLQMQQPQYQQQQQQQQQETEESKLKRYFYNRAQAEAEKAEDYLAELDRLARGAKLEHEMPHSALEALIREKFVLGLKDKHVQVTIPLVVIIQKHKCECS